MVSKIFSKNTESGKQNFYIRVNGKEIYLFSQKNYKSVCAFYGKELTVDRAMDFSASTGRTVSRTMEKLRAYIPYIEKEYGVSVLNKTKNARRPKKTVRTQWDYDEVA